MGRAAKLDGGLRQVVRQFRRVESKYRYNQQAGALNEIVPAPARARRHDTIPGGVPIPQQQQAVPVPVASEISNVATLTTSAFGRQLLHAPAPPIGAQSALVPAGAPDFGTLPRAVRTALVRDQRAAAAAN